MEITSAIAKPFTGWEVGNIVEFTTLSDRGRVVRGTLVGFYGRYRVTVAQCTDGITHRPLKSELTLLVKSAYPQIVP